jgi:O-antigen/teichoic acid export membrane protein
VPSVSWQTSVLANLPRRLWVAGAAWAARVLSAATQLVSVALLVPFLGVEGYAAFSVVTSLAGWFALADFGLGFALQNLVSEAKAKGRPPDSVLNAATPIVLGLVTANLAGLFFFGGLLQRFLFRGFGEGVSREPPYLVTLVGVMYVVAAVGGVSYRVFYTEHRGYLGPMYQGVANVVALGFLALLASAYNGTAKLLVSLIAWTLPQAVAAIVGYWQAFHKVVRSVRANWEVVGSVWKRSVEFGAFSFMASAVLGVDYLVMSQTLSSHDIAVYSIMSKAFNFAFFVYNALLWAAWPECTEMYCRGEFAELGSTLTRHIQAGALLVVAGTMLIYAGRGLILRILAPDVPLAISDVTVLLFATYYLVRVWTDTYGMALQSASYMRPFWVMVPVQAAISVTTQYFLSRAYGLNGILAGLILAFPLDKSPILARQSPRHRSDES